MFSLYIWSGRLQTIFLLACVFRTFKGAGRAGQILHHSIAPRGASALPLEVLVHYSYTYKRKHKTDFVKEYWKDGKLAITIILQGVEFDFIECFFCSSGRPLVRLAGPGQEGEPAPSGSVGGGGTARGDERGLSRTRSGADRLVLRRRRRLRAAEAAVQLE